MGASRHRRVSPGRALPAAWPRTCGSQPRGSEVSGKANNCKHERAGPWWCLGEQELVHVERGCNGYSVPCMSFNNATLLWQSWFPPQAFPITDLLTLIPSGLLFPANSSQSSPRVFSPNLKFQSSSAPAYTCLRLEYAGL